MDRIYSQIENSLSFKKIISSGIIFFLIIILLSNAAQATVYRWIPSSGVTVASGITTNWGTCGSTPSSFVITLLTTASTSDCPQDSWHESGPLDPAVDMFFNTSHNVDTNVQGNWYYGRIKDSSVVSEDIFTFRLIYAYPNGTIGILPGNGSISINVNVDTDYNISLTNISGTIPAGAKLGLSISKSGNSVMRIYFGDTANKNNTGPSGFFSVTETPSGDITPPVVSSIVRGGTNPTNAASVDFTVTFNESVTGVDTADFTLTTAGVSGASVSSVSGSGNSYTVTVNTGTGDGTIRLDVGDDDSIQDVASNRLGGTGLGNGNFTSGEMYNIDKTSPGLVLSSITANPTNGLIAVAAEFSEDVAGFASGDISVTNGSVENFIVVDGNTFTFDINPTDGPGMAVEISVPAGAAQDAVANGNIVSNILLFTSDTAPPTITGSTPAGSNVPVTTQITVTFSEMMNQSSVQSAFSTSPATTGIFSWSGNTMIYTPSSILAYGIPYDVTIGAGAKDLADNSLMPYIWQFTTATPPEQKVIYVPWIAFSQSSWNTPIQVQNIDSEPALVNVTMYDQNGNIVQTQPATIQPRTSSVFWPPAGQTDGGSAIVNSNKNVTAIVNEMPKSGMDSMSYSGFSKGAKKLYIPWIAYSQSDWYTPVQIQNIDDTAADVSVAMYDQNGNLVQTQTATIQPKTSAVFWPPAAQTDGGSAIINSNKNVTAIVNEMSKSGPQSMSYEGFLSGSKKAYIPVIYFSQANVYAPIQVQNIGTGSASVSVKFYDTNGEIIQTQNVGIAASSAAVFWPPAASTQTGSAVIDSNEDVIAIVNEMINNSTWGMSYRGFSVGASQVYVPWIAYGDSGWNTPLFVQNTGVLDATADMTFYDQNGGIVETKSVLILGGMSKMLAPASTAPTAGGSVMITSLQPLAVTVHEIDATSISAMSYCWGFGLGIS